MKVYHIDRPTWQSFVDTCPGSTFFHTPAWHKVWEEYADYKPDPLLFVFPNKKEILVPLSYQLRGKGLFKKYMSSPAGTYGGPICVQSIQQDEVNKIFNYLTSYSSLTIRISPFQKTENVFYKNIKNDFTQVIRLDESDKVQNNWSKNGIRCLKIANRHELKVSIANTKKKWDEYYEVYQDSVLRWGINATNMYAKPIFNYLANLNQNKCRLWIIEKGDKIISGFLCFYHQNHVVYWHGATKKDAFKYRPVHLLIFTVIEHAKKHGYDILDLNPSGGHEGVIKFKNNFGVNILNSSVYCLESKKYNFFRKLEKYKSNG